MRQSAFGVWVEFKNSSAVANTCTSKPADLISLLNDLRIEISSSITVIVGIEALPIDSSLGSENNYTLVVD